MISVGISSASNIWISLKIKFISILISVIQTGSGPAATVTQVMPSPPKISTTDVLQKVLKERPITGAGGIIDINALMAGKGIGGGEGGGDGAGILVIIYEQQTGV